MNETTRQYYLKMIYDAAIKYKNKITMEEFYEILKIGDATGDGRFNNSEDIKRPIIEAYNDIN